MHKTHKNMVAVATNDHLVEDTSSVSHSNSSPITCSQLTPQQLLEKVKQLPQDFALVAVGSNKAPLGSGWQNKPLVLKDFEEAVEFGIFKSLSMKSKEASHPSIEQWRAIGVLCGTPSNGLLFVDHDGASCDLLIQSLSEQATTEALPWTLTVTSGREGRFQSIYSVPEQYWDSITAKKISTGKKDKDGKAEQLEFRWNGCQSIVAGYHPLTGSYYWLPGQGPGECEIVQAPHWMIKQMLKKKPHRPAQTKSYGHSVTSAWSDQDWALSYLAAIPSTEDYETWIHVGMCLHTVDESLLHEWDCWSQGAANYKPEECDRKWRTFKPNKGLGLGTLGQLAKQNGWQSPLKGHTSPAQSSYKTGTNTKAASFTPENNAEAFEELAQEVQSFVSLTEETAPIGSLLSPALTYPLMQRAKQFNVPVEAFVAILLPIAASLLKIGTQLDIAESTDYSCPPILWFVLLGESGANKSPILDTLLRPLEMLQSQADESHQLNLAQYDEELKDWQTCPKEKRGNKPIEPIQREYYLQDATWEAIAFCLSTQSDRGIVIPLDEFASLFNGLNQYRPGGKGNDRQKYLTAYNGGAIKVNRKAGQRISLAQTSISLTGTIQPCVLRKQMSDLDQVDGFWSRFCWVPLPLTEMPPPSNGANHNLSALLQNLYQGLEALPPTFYWLDTESQTIWRDWHMFCERQKVDESNPALRAIYPKSKERAARIALVVHCINAVIEGQIPEPTISSAVLEAAIAFTKWSIGQARLIYADAGAVSYAETAKIVRFVERFRGSGWITARNVTHWSPAKPKPNAEQARVFMKQVVELGYAIDNGKPGREYAICIQESVPNNE